MATFYFYYGVVGHSERICATKKGDAKAKQLLEGQYSDWLRADLRSASFKHTRTID